MDSILQSIEDWFRELLVSGIIAKKKEAYREYRKAKQEMTDFATAKYDIERFLNLEKEEETRENEKAKTEEESL